MLHLQLNYAQIYRLRNHKRLKSGIFQSPVIDQSSLIEGLQSKITTRLGIIKPNYLS
jgi:hypothetical protein